MQINNLARTFDVRPDLPLSQNETNDSHQRITDTFKKSEQVSEPIPKEIKRAGRLKDMADILGMASFFGSPVTFFVILAATNSTPLGALGALILTATGCLVSFQLGESANKVLQKNS